MWGFKGKNFVELIISSAACNTVAIAFSATHFTRLPQLACAAADGK
jgi:hypothetical protein